MAGVLELDNLPPQNIQLFYENTTIRIQAWMYVDVMDPLSVSVVSVSSAGATQSNLANITD